VQVAFILPVCVVKKMLQGFVVLAFNTETYYNCYLSFVTCHLHVFGCTAGYLITYIPLVYVGKYCSIFGNNFLGFSFFKCQILCIILHVSVLSILMHIPNSEQILLS